MADITAPAGTLTAWKLVARDFTSYSNYRWPYPGQWATPEPEGGINRPFSEGGPCPLYPGDGLCLAKAAAGACSGGLSIGNALGLDLAYHEADILGQDENKLRVRKAYVVGCFDPTKRLCVPSANLRVANLRGANLRDADLWNADLRVANLRDADLRVANLRGADLRDADLRVANLRGADLRDADLRDADLWNADLRVANLRGANLRDADLRVANLRDADLRVADLRGADLWGANLWGARANASTLWTPGFDAVARGVVAPSAPLVLGGSE